MHKKPTTKTSCPPCHTSPPSPASSALHPSPFSLSRSQSSAVLPCALWVPPSLPSHSARSCCSKVNNKRRYLPLPPHLSPLTSRSADLSLYRPRRVATVGRCSRAERQVKNCRRRSVRLLPTPDSTRTPHPTLTTAPRHSLPYGVYRSCGNVAAQERSWPR